MFMYTGWVVPFPLDMGFVAGSFLAGLLMAAGLVVERDVDKCGISG
jgi:hypothetical protein